MKHRYHYTESGLDTVVIEGVDLLTDDAGEECITIPNVNELHHAIAQGIVSRQTGMAGDELRFLRTEMGMTQAQLAAVLHREPLSVSRWERGECPIDSNAEALVRLYAIEELKLKREPVREIAGWCVQSAETPPIVIDGSDPEHYQLVNMAA
ncbi:MAG: helix-turn-helix domain-containing protein [Hyphomicrobiales bacterium]|nr:helix-turn-helix domain-containing protein [Hyphomicrobiales bacterium]